MRPTPKEAGAALAPATGTGPDRQDEDGALLDPVYAQHIQEELTYVQGLLAAIEEIDVLASEAPVRAVATQSLKTAMRRALDDLSAVVEGYTEPPRWPLRKH